MEHASHELCGVCGLVPVVPRLKGATKVVCKSPVMQRALKRVARFAGSDAPLAVFGETGTGKEVIARLLHANSRRAGHPFVPVNVAALPPELLESELFGHGKGAFTGASAARPGLFEAAHQGTLFLDEIGEMPLPLQAKLLRALQDGEIRRLGESQPFVVDVRVICATHRDLGQLVHAGLFREDLFYRLKVLSIEVPPLRERPEDILPLALRMLRDERPELTGFTPGARERLLGHPWPGNVRELQNAVKHGAALCTTGDVSEEDLPAELASTPAAAARSTEPARFRPLAEVEREYILRVLAACNGSQSEAARVLGMARNTLWRKLRALSDSDSG
jgi:two-component system response regulator HydG